MNRFHLLFAANSLAFWVGELSDILQTAAIIALTMSFTNEAHLYEQSD